MASRPRPLSLAALTVIDLSPPEMVSCAGAAGYSHVGLRLIPATPEERVYPAIGDTPMVREIRTRLADGNVQVLDVEVFRLKPDTQVASFEAAIATAASLGARHLLTTGQDPDVSRLADTFASLCALAARFGLTADLEFMPWIEISTLQKADELLRRAGCSNGGMIVDALHFARTGATLDGLRAVNPERLHFAQLCDAPLAKPTSTEAIIHEARNGRLPPGHGELDLAGLLRTLPAHLPLSLEVPTAGIAASVPAVDRARAVRDAAVAVLASTFEHGSH